MAFLYAGHASWPIKGQHNCEGKTLNKEDYGNDYDFISIDFRDIDNVNHLNN
jgi:hypothetical protein